MRGLERTGNRYTVRERAEPSGWTVHILDRAARPVHACRFATEAQARTYASAVRQHIHWLSEGRFRRQYRLSGPAE